MTKTSTTLLDRKILGDAITGSFRKLDPVCSYVIP